MRQGHDVTLFASGDSLTSATLVRCCDVALRFNPAVRDALPYHMIMLDEVRRRIDQFDILHFHIDIIHAALVNDFADRTSDHAAWPIGPTRSCALLLRLSRSPARLDFE